MTAVLDASAALALLRREDGHEIVAELINGAVTSAVNWSEIVQKGLQRNWPSTAVESLRSAGLRVVAFGPDDAELAAAYWPRTRDAGLSLADRACLALAAVENDGRAVTADRVWAGLDLDVPVQLIR